ncbi:hypothetical protein ACHAWF_013312, partial [Thalassiosira exigua]
GEEEEEEDRSEEGEGGEGEGGEAAQGSDSPAVPTSGAPPPPDRPGRDRPPSAPDALGRPALLPRTTPTNAYYRFLVRRGPRGHFAAALTLVLVQWIHRYIPLGYMCAASTLRKLRIYDPEVLWERDRRREMERRFGPPPQKATFASKLFGSSSSSSSSKKAKATMQRRSDEDATAKLKRLYKAAVAGGTPSEVKYRYLSAGFRRKHGLGTEFRTRKPRSFLGELVEGSVGGTAPAGAGEEEEEAVLSDEEADPRDAEPEGRGTEGSKGDEAAAALAGPRRGPTPRGGERRRRVVPPKRKAIDDWVAAAFVRPARGGRDAPTTSSSLWDAADRRAILDAALGSAAEEARAASAAARDGRRRTAEDDAERIGAGVDGDRSLGGSAPSAGGYGSYGASAFKSALTKVGSANGRILGAYPNDAPPIEECAHERGVIGLAR